jgi:phosphohistidine swiveling domain-containing protein/membrane-associated phospholipid phosphatase
MNESLAVLLRGLGTTIEMVGGKAHALDQLIAIGAPVPACGVLTTCAYRDFASGSVLTAQLAALRDEPLPEIGAEDEARRRVDELFLQAPMPSPVRDAIDDLVGAVGGEGGLAIRSSATAEDLESASFAGQYRSFLGVSPVDVERSVRLAWASLWHPAPRAYRAYHGVGDGSLAMALIVMPMLSPVVAGVAFTREPDADIDVMRIELVHGLGEGLVSGALTPEVFIVDRSGTDVADLADLAAVAGPLAGLPALAARIEDEFGAPQDLEWAVAGEQLWMLQARPITASDREGSDDGFDVHPPADMDWTTAGIAEMLPGILPPRLWELDSWLVEEAFRRLFSLLGGDVALLAEPHALIARYRARAALDLDAMRAEIASIPGGSPAELEYEYFGDAGSCERVDHGHAGLRQSVRLLRARNAAAQEAEIVVCTAELLLDDEPELRSIDDADLSALRARLRDVAARAMAAEVIVAALAAAAYQAVEALLARHVGVDEAKSLAQRVTGSVGQAGNALTAALDPLVEAARGCMHSGESRGAAAPAWLDVRASTPYRTALRRAGSRSVCGGPTWEEAPDQAWAVFQVLVGRGATVGAAESIRCASRTNAEEVLHSDPRWRTARAMGGMLADPRRAFLRREADDATELLQRREQVKAAVLMIGGMVRRVDLEIGRRLVDRGDLSVVDDVDLLTFKESRQLLLRRRDEPPCIAPGTISNRRRRLRSAELDGPLPRRFSGRTPPEATPMGPAVGRGWGASAGRYEGVARVVESPGAAAGFRSGDVLVARTTDASWMPLFLMAGAIVVEDGGPLSHAAIIARELGVPSIVNIPGIVDRLAGLVDAVVVVDGTTGEIVIRDTRDQDDRDRDSRVRDSRSASDPVSGVAPVRTPPTIDSASGLHVFVTGLIGAGALLSVVMSLAERVGGVRGRARLVRRAEPVARTVATAIVCGYDETASSSVGLRPRRWYVIVSTLLAGVAVAVGARTTADYWGSDPDSWRAVLAWSATVASTLTVAGAAAVSARSALRWPVVAPSVRRLAAPRSAAPGVTDVLGSWRRVAVMALLAIVGVLAAAVTMRLPAMVRFDRWLYDLIGAGETADRVTPGVVNALGKPIVVIPLAIGLAVVARRCRTLAVMIPTAIVGTGIAVFALTWLTRRDRPTLGAHAGEQNSFPGGHAAQLTLLFGLLVLVARIVTDRRWWHHLATIGSGLILVVVLTDTVRTGGHWPTDQLAGFLIAVAVLLAVSARVDSPECHSSCGVACPTKGVAHDRHPTST